MSALNARSSQCSNDESEDAFEQVRRLPGVVTCPSLKKWFLGIVASHDILCCIVCPKLTCLNLSTCAEHYKKTHAKPQERIPNSEIKATVQRYNVYAGLLDKYPRPPWPCGPLPFLEAPEPGFMCVICDSVDEEYFATREDTAERHYRQHHKRDPASIDFKKSLQVVHLQAFTPSSYSSRKWFRVEPNAQAPEQVDPESGVLPASPRDLWTTYLSTWEPAELVRPDTATLKMVMPFLFTTGYADHVDGKDVRYLVSLVARPTSRGDPLRELYNQIVAAFKEEQETLDRVAGPIRLALMDEGHGQTEVRYFKALAQATRSDYANTLALWAVFVCRLYANAAAGDTRYVVDMTHNQRRTVEWAWKFARKERGRARIERLIGVLAEAFWCPDSANNFDQMVDDQYNDPTMRFALIMCLQENGMFMSPRNAANELVRIKYAIRFGMFLYAKQTLLKEARSLNGIPALVASSLSRRRLSPFACICTTTSHATTYSSTSTTLPNVIWEPDGRHMLLDGQTMSWDTMRKGWAGEAVNLETFFYERVLMGIPLEELDFDIDENTKITDNQTCTAEGYSLFTDPHNPFHRLRFSLVSAILKRPELSVRFFEGLTDKDDEEKRAIAWNLLGSKEWLDSTEEFSRRLMRLMHALGGQPGRGVEVAMLKLYNTKLRLRNFFCLGPGIIAYILQYSKTTGQTGMDKIVAHAVPWRVGRLFLAYHSLVTPFASVLVGELYGSERRSKHEHSAFSASGQEPRAEDLSALIQEFFRETCNIDVRLRLFRHLIIACQRQFMPEAFAPVRQSQRVVDQQAGHTSETADDHYAIEPGEVRFVKSSTIRKFIAASARWWAVLWGDMEGMLLPKEKDMSNRAAQVISESVADESDLFVPTTHTFTPAIVDTNELARHIVKEAGLTAQGLAQALIASIVGSASTQSLVTPEAATGIVSAAGIPSNNDALTGLAQCLLSFAGGPIHHIQGPLLVKQASVRPHPPAAVVQYSHLHYLRIYTDNPTAQWTCREQAQAFVLIKERQQSMLVVLPTGAGKSILFGSMPMMEPSVNVAVFPLRALALDQMEITKELDPKSQMVRWEPSLEIAQGLVAVSIKQASEKPFLTWCTKLKTRGRLARIYFDECHLISATTAYRHHSMDNLDHLVQLGVPLIGLTATLPPALEEDLRERLGSPNWRVIRACTQRPNIKFDFARYQSKSAAMESLIKHVKAFKLELRQGEGIMIVCRNYYDVNRVFERLGSLAQGVLKHAGDMGEDERDEAARAWLNFEYQIVVCTSGLGAGIHHRTCRCTLHFNLSSGLVDYMQEVGRSGRDGLAALALTFFWKDTPSESYPDPSLYRALMEMMTSGECMRYRISRDIDGLALVELCSSFKCLACGNCSRLIKETTSMPTNDKEVALFGPGILPKEPSFVHDTHWMARSLLRDDPTAAAAPPPDPVQLSQPAPPNQPQLPHTVRNHNLAANHHDASAVHPQPRQQPASNRSHAAGPSNAPSAPRALAAPRQAGPSNIAQRIIAAEFAHPMPPAGPQLVRDANRWQGAPNRTYPANQQQEDAYRPLDYGTFLDVRRSWRDVCQWCWLMGHPDDRHEMSMCNVAPYPSIENWNLDPYNIFEAGFDNRGQPTQVERLFKATRDEWSAKKKLPADRSICFKCLWPWAKKWMHAPSLQGNSSECMFGNVILQVCWLVFWDVDIRTSCLAYFGLGAMSLNGWMEWLHVCVRSLHYDGLYTAIYNFQRVFLWASEVHRRKVLAAGPQ